MFIGEEAVEEENDTYIHPEHEEYNDTSMQQQDLYPDRGGNPDRENPLQNHQNDVKEMVEFWGRWGKRVFRAIPMVHRTLGDELEEIPSGIGVTSFDTFSYRNSLFIYGWVGFNQSFV